MDRRGFISALLGTAGAMVLDPDRLLWRPGAKRISIPAPSPAPRITMIPIGQRLNKGDLFSIAGVYQVNPERRDSPQIFTVTRVLPDGLQVELKPATQEDYVNAKAIMFQEEMTKAEAARRYPGSFYFTHESAY